MSEEKRDKEELLKAVIDVLNEAFAEVEKLEKSEAAQAASNSSPTTAEAPKAEAAAPAPAAAPAAAPAEAVAKSETPEAPKAEPAAAAPAAEAQAPAAAPAQAPAPAAEAQAQAVAKAEGKPEDEDEDEDDEEEKDKDKDSEESDDKLMDTYKALSEKLTARGLIRKSEPSEDPRYEELKKSTEGQIDDLKKTVESLTGTIRKLSEMPAPRRGLSGVTPIYKHNDGEGPKGAETLSKNELVEALLAKKAGGDKRVDTSLIYKAERGQLGRADLEKINGIL